MKVGPFICLEKSKFSYEAKLKAVKQYLNGEGSYNQLANKFGLQSSYQFKAMGYQV